MKDDHRSVNTQLLRWRKESLKKIHDLCDTGAALYQLGAGRRIEIVL